MTSKGNSLIFFVQAEELADQSKSIISKCDYFCCCRNFDEILSSFADSFLENASFLESCSSLYEEENFRVCAFSVFTVTHPWQCISQFVCPLQNSRENPIHIINVSLKSSDTEDDDALVTAFTDFTQSKVNDYFTFES